MPLPISTAAIIEKNKLASSSPWLLLLEIQYEDETPIRVVWNTENITWRGVEWMAAPFHLGELEESKDDNVSTCSLSVVDINRQLTPALDMYNGGVGATVYIRVVHADYLNYETPEVEIQMYITAVTIDHNNTITFTLGAENLANRRNPRDRFLKSHCRYKQFKGSLCGYSGSETECNRTFARCKQLGNERRFGGFPGVGRLGYIE